MTVRSRFLSHHRQFPWPSEPAGLSSCASTFQRAINQTGQIWRIRWVGKAFKLRLGDLFSDLLTIVTHWIVNGDFQEKLLLTKKQALFNEVFTNYLDKCLYYKDSDFKLDCLKFYYRINGNANHPLLNFKASRHFIQSFRDRHRMRLRWPSFKRRRPARPEDIDRFITRIQTLIQKLRNCIELG
jgi:hypothetical protein